MNTKVALGVLALVIIGAGAYVASRYVHPAPTTPLEVFAPVGTSSAASTGAPGGQSSTAGAPANVPAIQVPAGATITQGAPIKTITHITLAFDKPLYTTANPYPTFGGTGSNVTSADIIVRDSAGKGIEAATIAIKGGRWSYPSSVALAPGNYTVWLGTEGLVVEAKLTVTRE